MPSFLKYIEESGLGFCSFAHRSLAHLLMSLKSNERLRAICSDHSRQISDCEQIPQVAHIKRATVSGLLRSLMTNEGLSALRSGHSLIFGYYQVGNTSSRKITEFKQLGPWLALGWVTIQAQWAPKVYPFFPKIVNF